MRPPEAPEFPGWKFVGEAPLADQAASYFRDSAVTERREVRFWGAASALAILILVCGPWLIIKSIGTDWIGPVATGVVVVLLSAWIPIYFWREARLSLALALRITGKGGYWVYEPLTQEALSAFRAEVEDGAAEGFEPKNTGQRYVWKEPGPASGSASKPQKPKLLPETRKKIKALRVPAIGISDAEDAGFSQFGGVPTVPSGFIWPMTDGVGLSFLAQIDLTQIKDPRLPPTGCLYFFEHESIIGRVLYCQGDTGQFIVAMPPKGNEKPVLEYEARPLQFESSFVYPSASTPEVEALGLPEDQLNAYIELQMSQWPDRLLGVPDPTQNVDMDRECHLASGGLSRDAGEWKLLLQLSGEEAWGDLGKLFFWIREEDLANRNFDRVQMIVQFD